MKIYPAIATLCMVAFAAGCGGKKPAEIHISVDFPSGVEGIAVPVTAVMPEAMDLSAGAWEAVPAGISGQATAVQPLGTDSIAFVWTPDKAGTVEFMLRASSEAVDGFSFAGDKPYRLMLSEDGAPVIGYVHGMHLAEGVPEDRRRASYFHPVHAPDGTVLSDDFPEDHYHHRGIFWTLPQVFVGGDTLSLWDIRGVKQQFDEWLVRETGPVFARLGVRNGWYTDDGRRIVDERVVATIYSGSELGRMMDFELTWEAVDDPVGIQGSADIKGYGGFSLRFAPFEDPRLTTIGGPQAEDSNRIPFAWADLSARFDGSRSFAGAAIFDHRDNVDFPNGWCLRHYGFVGIAWPGIKPHWLEPGNPLTARYRVWLHTGDADSGQVSAAYASWSTPPAVTTSDN